MDIEFTPHGWEDFTYWLETDRKTASRILRLIHSIHRTPYSGPGKPEPLRFGLKGYWSRRITVEHRLVYKISGNAGVDQKCTIIQCRFHYE